MMECQAGVSYQEGNSAQAKHYIDARMEPIEVMQSLMPPVMFQGFLLGNLMKYTLRVKNPKADPLKAKQYDYWLYLARTGVTIRPLTHVCPDHPYGLMYMLPQKEQEERYLMIDDYRAEVECAERTKAESKRRCDTVSPPPEVNDDPILNIVPDNNGKPIVISKGRFNPKDVPEVEQVCVNCKFCSHKIDYSHICKTCEQGKGTPARTKFVLKEHMIKKFDLHKVPEKDRVCINCSFSDAWRSIGDPFVCPDCGITNGGKSTNFLLAKELTL